MSFGDWFFDIAGKIILLGLFIVFLPLILAITVIYILTNGFAKKCKYYKKCKLYSPQSKTCTNNAGEYHAGFIETKPANCKMKMEELYDRHYR